MFWCRRVVIGSLGEADDQLVLNIVVISLFSSPTVLLKRCYLKCSPYTRYVFLGSRHVKIFGGSQLPYAWDGLEVLFIGSSMVCHIHLCRSSGFIATHECDCQTLGSNRMPTLGLSRRAYILNV